MGKCSQTFLDIQAFNTWLGNCPTNQFSERDAWHAALAYRDKQNAEDLKGLVDVFGPRTLSSGGQGTTTEFRLHPSYNSLRKRCGLDK